MQDIHVPPSLGRSDRTELHRTPRPRRNSTIRWMGLVSLDSASFWFVAFVVETACRSGSTCCCALRGKLAGWLLKINHNHHHRPPTVISPCASPSFGLSPVFALPWCSGVTQPGTDTHQTRTLSYLHLEHRCSLPSTYLRERELMTRLLLWSCTPELGLNRSRLLMLTTHFIPLLGRDLRFSFHSLVPGSSGSELREVDTVSQTFTSTECLSGLWTPGTRFRGDNNDCSGSTDSLVGDTT